MSYADRLKAEIQAKGAPSLTDKTDKRASVSSVSSSDGGIPPLERPPRGTATPAESAEITARMRELWGRYGWLDHPDFPEALQLALRDPGAALDSLRADGGER